MRQECPESSASTADTPVLRRIRGGLRPFEPCPEGRLSCRRRMRSHPRPQERQESQPYAKTACPNGKPALTAAEGRSCRQRHTIRCKVAEGRTPRTWSEARVRCVTAFDPSDDAA